MLTPRPYQIEGRDFLATRRFALLADEMRLGKSPQAVLAAEKAGVRELIVVCPAIAVPHWNRELDRWWSARGREGRAYVMSYDRLRLEAKMWLARRYDLAIIDECHFAKSPAAQRTKLIYGKGGLGWCADRLWALSGTPMPNHPAELWPMLRAFGVVGLTYQEFINRYCIVDGLGVIRGTRTQMIPELKALLATIMLRRTRKEVAPDMPAIDFQFLEVEPTGSAGIDPRLDLSDEDFLQWMESHPTADREDRIAVALAKVPALVEHIKFAIDNKLLTQAVAFGWHVEPLTILSNTLNNAGIRTAVLNGATGPKQREVIQRQLREGYLAVVAANILAAGTAVDLSAARHSYFLELDWTSANNIQAANRLISMEKADRVTSDIVVWRGSADDRVQRTLLRKMTDVRAMGLA